MADMEENVSVSYFKSLIYCINIIIIVVVVIMTIFFYVTPLYSALCCLQVFCRPSSPNFSCVPCDPGSRFARVLTITMITIVPDRDL